MTGFRLVIGSWKIMATRDPRSFSMADSGNAARSLPSSRIRPPASRPCGRGTNPITDSAVTDLPQPDSPTNASVSRGVMLKEMSSTAACQAPSMRNSVRIRSTDSAAWAMAAASAVWPVVATVRAPAPDRSDGYQMCVGQAIPAQGDPERLSNTLREPGSPTRIRGWCRCC